MSNGTQPATPKKGLSPLAWIGIGCGCLLLLAILAGVGTTFYLAHKAKHALTEFQHNPALAAARLVVKANPDLEEVAVDEKAGTITVRNKKSGEEVTLNLDDVGKGRISVSTDKGKVTLQPTEEGGGMRLSGESDQGSFNLQAGAGGSAKIPDWVPSYRGVAPTGSYSMEQEGTVTGGFELATPDSVDVVLEHFRQELKQADFEVHVNTFSGDHGTSAATLTAENQASKRSVTVMVAQQEGGASVTVTYSSGK